MSVANAKRTARGDFPSRTNTSLERALHEQLTEQRILDTIPQVRFGRYVVDFYSPELRAVFEADGDYWHGVTEAARPGYGAQRDAVLLDFPGINHVFHFTDKDLARA